MSVEPLYTVPDPLHALTSKAQRDGAIAALDRLVVRVYTKADIYMWAVRGSKVSTLSQRPGNIASPLFPAVRKLRTRCLETRMTQKKGKRTMPVVCCSCTLFWNPYREPPITI